jgi:tetratricopeptide (TPR) repeat protein
VVAQRAGTPPYPPILSGIVPPLADSYYQRPETGLALRAALYPGDTLVLTDDTWAYDTGAYDTDNASVAASGGTGKTQLAVAYAHALWSVRAVEVLIWVTAASRDTIIAGFAQAAVAVGALGAAGQDGRGQNERGQNERGQNAEAAAARFAAWLAETDRSWALILDDLSDLADLADVWPAGPAGHVVITTRLPEDAVAAVAAAAAGIRIAPVSGFNRREALTYLSARLTDYPDQRIEALDLGEDLDGLPLGLAQAAAVMRMSGLSAREYRSRLAERRADMSGVRVDGVPAAVLATWSLAAECAHELAPAGLAWPALALAAMLDPHGIPATVLTSPAACGYITGRPSTAVGADQNMVRAALTNLAQAGLISIDHVSQVRTVRMHACVRAAVRAYLPPADLEQAVLAAADALIQVWPEPSGAARVRLEHDPFERAPFERAPFERAPFERAPFERAQLDQVQFDQALRECAAALPVTEDGPLWKPEAHPVLLRQGISLQDSGLTGSAIGYWQALLATSIRLLGTGHAQSVAARDRLAVAFAAARRSGDAIAVFQTALADRERHQGFEHPDTIAARGYLAGAYSGAGQPAQAIVLYEQMVGDASRRLGLGHPVTLTGRAGLAQAYLAAGRASDALAAYRMLLTDTKRILGPDHPMTRSVRGDLGHAAGTGS